MKNISEKRKFDIAASIIICFFAVLFLGLIIFYLKNLPENIANAKRERYRSTILKLARDEKPFTLGQAIKLDWDEAKLFTHKYDTGFGNSPQEDYYCVIEQTNNESRNTLVLYKDKKYVFDFAFDENDDFTFAQDLETISADTVFVPAKAEISGKYILSLK